MTSRFSEANAIIYKTAPPIVSNVAALGLAAAMLACKLRFG